MYFLNKCFLTKKKNIFGKIVNLKSFKLLKCKNIKFRYYNISLLRKIRFNLNFYLISKNFKFFDYFLKNFFNINFFGKYYSNLYYNIFSLCFFFKTKLINLNLLLKFDKNLYHHYYITNDFSEDDYFTTLGEDFYFDNFFFFKSFKTIFNIKKNFILDAILLKKKSSTFKKTDFLKKFLFQKTYKLLLFNEEYTTPQNYNSYNFCDFENFSDMDLDNFYEDDLDDEEDEELDFELFDFDEGFELDDDEDLHKDLRVRKGFFKILLENRKLIKTLFFFKTKKQKYINKFLSKKNFLPTKKFYLNQEFNIINILIRSQFFFLKSDVLFFLNSGYVCLNGSIIYNANITCKVGDRIQLLFNNNYYYYFRAKKYFSDEFLKKIIIKFQRMKRPGNDFYKQKSSYFPNWIFKMIYYYNDIPLFLEVDFTIMTSIIFTKPYSFYDYNILNWAFLSSYLYRLYNWKRVT